ncbi:tetratricopeptide repeat protein [Legionella lytica]|uniref:Tetratricopeptide repeat protein n=1 Tax=Legionella lytica TaxID=96232 RepID=A0ABY4Y8X8_9GAMM|nr:tetratricopeptide repeat protein [Legionella lytica]USQ13896.1 tetratricopeptide repeat protein [Legionella lytica]
MMRYLTLLFTSFLSLSAQAWQWQDLWSTPDQQGQELMNKQQYKEAGTTFNRDDWAAAAAYRAGDYQRASELYQKQHDEQGYYNAGNALAHLGKYKEAIAAYDKALAINPKNQDAIDNRKLLEKLLQQKEQKQDQQKQDQQKQDQQKQDQQKQDQQKQDQQKQDQQKQDQQKQDQQKQDQQKQDQQKQDQQKQDQQKQDQQKQDQQKQDQQKQDQQKQDQQKQDQQKQDQQKQDQQKQDQQKQDQQKQDQQKQDQEMQAKKDSKAEQEKQQVQEQWLRLIPDDPGGLLREKFLRDHLRRERGWYQ